jgi:sRNA-binding carbon storage regulator CsrA
MAVKTGALLLSRRQTESVRIVFGGQTLLLTVAEIVGRKAKLLFEGPETFEVSRVEVNRKSRPEKNGGDK